MLSTFKELIKQLPPFAHYFYRRQLYCYFRNEYPDVTEINFKRLSTPYLKVILPKKTKVEQIIKLVDVCELFPLNNDSFFYSIDPYKKCVAENMVFDNYTICYNWAVNSCFKESLLLAENDTGFRRKQEMLVSALQTYVNRLSNSDIAKDFKDSIGEINSLFFRPASCFHEALQRILFVNQWLWQTGHKLNGLGHLDWILEDLYCSDIKTGRLTRESAKQLIKDFFIVLHDKFWFKSTMLLGDTGQIIILGGKDRNEKYHYNELTYIMIEASEELKLPDPKVLLRVSRDMPDDLLRKALECISTGIGAPFLSNDDEVIPKLIQFGYDESDAYEYGTSACWEPLIAGKSCEQNNIRMINFCKPFSDYTDSEEFAKCSDIDAVLYGYFQFLESYIDEELSDLDHLVFEEDPILTLFSPDALKRGKDITKGGATYVNLGLTSVGMATVVNSLINIKRLVFAEKKYTLEQLNRFRKENYVDHESIAAELNKSAICFGNDSAEAVELTNRILREATKTFEKHHNALGGSYKFGLSSPSYITGARNIGATFDGRKAGMPFATHISGKNGVTPTELINFASQLDYGENRFNGNVVDFFVSPGFIQNHMDKMVQLIKGGIRQGFFQLQMNVVDSKTLIEAQKHPEQFPNLVVRVWGFSAYFKDLPKEYQDNLIRRAIEAEAA